MENFFKTIVLNIMPILGSLAVVGMIIGLAAKGCHP